MTILSISAKYDKCCSIAIVLCRVPLAHQGTLTHEKQYVFPPLRLATESVPNNTLTNNHQSADIHATRNGSGTKQIPRSGPRFRSPRQTGTRNLCRSGAFLLRERNKLSRCRCRLIDDWVLCGVSVAYK